MESRVLPAVIAVIGGVLLAVLLLVPFIYRSYRRRGELGLGGAVVAFAFLVYAIALIAYTLLPLPSIDESWCAEHSRFGTPQLDPLRIVADIREHAGVLGNAAVQQGMFNIALFVPLGAFLRAHLRRRGVPTVVLAGLGVSLLIEFTQLTGNWFLFPCPYRLFDVDDLIANTLGTAIGVLAAPMIRRLQGDPRLPAGAPRPVTTGRRLLGMLVDLVSVFLLGALMSVAANLLTWYTTGGYLNDNRVAGTVLTTWLPAVLLLVLPSLAPAGATFGQRAVRLHRTGPDGGRAGVRVLPALLTGTFGYYVLAGLDGWVPAAGTLSLVLLVAGGVLAWRPRSHPGLSGVVSGLRVVDARAADSREPVRSA
ncbi:VanZ family protein [Actinophytocola gossypii]|uniref:VanZ family protein n=1 Tax=Actinophytocola gossypii TaxID=2812003 RepID=A0ABT2J2J6_9PSEU|nr:VanZ family protein [Actinophytocola gossypii]MCT2582082.1 VanZ family protein [Actinophytocola gossypii]